MSILATYADLLAEAPLWLRRPDQVSRIPTFIVLAEKQMNRSIRARRKIIRSIATITDEYSAVPADFGGARSMRLASGTRAQLSLVSPEQMADISAGGGGGGQLRFFALIGDEIQYGPWPASGGDVEMTYYAKIPDLATNLTNWVMTDHPDAYLFGALWQGYAFLKNVEKAAGFEAQFNAIIEEINDASMRESMSGAMTPTPSGFVV